MFFSFFVIAAPQYVYVRVAETACPAICMKMQLPVVLLKDFLEKHRAFQTGKFIIQLPSGKFGECPELLRDGAELHFLPLYHRLNIIYRTLLPNARSIAKKIANESEYPLDGFVHRCDKIALKVEVRAYQKVPLEKYLLRFKKESGIDIEKENFDTNEGVLHSHFKISADGFKRDDGVTSYDEEIVDWFSVKSDSVRCMYS